MNIDNLVIIFVSIGVWIGIGFWIGFFPLTMISIIGGAIFGLYLKLTGQI